MLIEITTLDGGRRSIAADTIIRFRPSFGAGEPPTATKIDYGGGTQFARDTLDDLAGKIGTAIRLARLTTPNGLAVCLDAGKVTDIAEADPAQHAPGARAVVTVGGQQQQVAETRAAATGIVNAALA